MTYFAGHAGSIRLKRAGGSAFTSEVSFDEVNTVLARVGFDGSLENLLTGDSVNIETSDTRGLLFIKTTAWTSGVVEKSIRAYVNVNAAGGLRLFPSFSDAVNNVRANEYALVSFTGDPVPINISVKDTTANILGSVEGYTINTDREAIDATSMSDRFRQQYSAGLISGNGSIDCLFSSTSTGLEETPLLMLQLIQRINIGSAFDCALYLTDKEVNSNADNVFYEFTGVITRAGLQVSSSELISCSIDFVTTGEIRLLVGTPVGYVLQENEDKIIIEPSLDFLLKEVDDQTWMIVRRLQNGGFQDYRTYGTQCIWPGVN